MSTVPGHYSAAELAALRLPGLPARPQHLNRRAAREGWAWVADPGGSRARLWSVASLPDAARAALAGAVPDLPAGVPPSRREVPPPEPRDLARQVPRRGRPSTVGADPEVRDVVEAMLAAHPHASAVHVRDAIRVRCDLPEPPSLRAVQRFLAGFRERERALFLTLQNPDAARGRYRAAHGLMEVRGFLDMVELDATPADVMTADGRRCTVSAAIDVWSRWVVLLVVPTSRALAVGALLRRVVAELGVPRAIRTDNGQEYTSLYVAEACRALGIERHVTAPFSPDRKPFIERALGTFARDLQPLLPGWTGPDVATREAIRARDSFARRLFEKGGTVEVRMTAAELQQLCDDWARARYGMRRHAGLGCSPFERRQRWLGPVRRVDDERALDVLLMEAPGGGLRTVGKKGIRLDGFTYGHAELGPRIGQRVAVKTDAAEPGILYVFEPEGAFVCKAWAPELVGLAPQEAAKVRAATAAAMRERQAARLSAEQRRMRQLAKRHGMDRIGVDILAADVAAAANVVALPRPTTVHATPDLEAAAVAARAALAAGEPAALPEAARAEARARIAAVEGGAAAPSLPRTGADGRPLGNDRALVLWLLERRETRDAYDRAWLRKQLSLDSVRMWTGIEVPPAWIWEDDGMKPPAGSQSRRAAG